MKEVFAFVRGPKSMVSLRKVRGMERAVVQWVGWVSAWAVMWR